MGTDRRERAKSIRAARDWLTGAEHALAGEDDLAGDLKLMLARAELARIAADRRARLRRWARWGLLPLVAAGISAWLMWQWSPVEEPRTTVAVQSEEMRVIPPVPVQEETPPAVQTEDAPPVPKHGEPSAETQAAPPSESPAAPVVGASPGPMHAEAAQSARAQIPNADLQRLMQVGGKILRE